MRAAEDFDTELIELLRVDARRSAASLARELGSTPSTVKRRIDALRACGAIAGYTIRTPETSEGAEAVVEVFCRGNVSTSELRDIVRDVPEVVTGVSVAGVADAVLIMRAPTLSLLSAAIEQVRTSPRVERTRSAIVFDRLV